MRRVAAERWVAQKKVAQKKVPQKGEHKKGGMAPLLFCDVVLAEFSAVDITDQCPRAIVAG